MRSKLSILISLTVISISFIFGGCGGGGGGDGGGGGGGATGIQYTGLTNQATIDENNAEQLAVGAYIGGDVGTVIGGRAVVQDGEIDRSRTIAVVEAIEKSILHIDVTASLDGAIYRDIITDSGTIIGNCGGSVSYAIEINDVTGEFTGTFNFSNYCEDDVTLSGNSSISGIFDLVIEEFIQLSMSFDSLTFTVAGDSFTVKGSITYDDLMASPVDVDMDLLMRDNSTEKVYWAHNYYLRISNGLDYMEFYIFGRYYDPDCGYVDVESTTDFRIYDVDLWPSSGVLIVEGDTGTFGGNTMARLTDYSCGACVVDADTDGGGSYNWSSGFLNMYFDEVDPPEAPYNLEPPNNEIIVGTEPTLSWTAGAHSCGFDVYLGTVNPPQTIVSSKQSETMFQPSGLVASMIYYWKVVAWNAIGSDSSDVRSFKTGVTTTLIGSYDTPDNARDIYVDSSYAYVADSGEGLQIIDISDPSSPSFTGAYDTPGDAGDVFVTNSYAYVADAWGGLQIIDISDPSNPSFVGFYDTPDNALNVFVTGSYAYVADAWGGLQIIDISDPSNPSFVGFYDTADVARAVHVIGTYAYVRDDNALLVIDISNPSSPSLTGSYVSPAYAFNIYVDGYYAYLADGGDDLQIVDISNPSSPSLAGSYVSPDWTLGVYAIGSYAYVAASYSGLQAIRVSN